MAPGALPERSDASGPNIVAYALQITDLDPIAYGLIFERFLNPDRISMPDFDIDFCVRGRDRVIDYVRAKYGADRVANIITYGKFGAKMIVRDLARVLEQFEGRRPLPGDDVRVLLEKLQAEQQ